MDVGCGEEVGGEGGWGVSPWRCAGSMVCQGVSIFWEGVLSYCVLAAEVIRKNLGRILL